MPPQFSHTLLADVIFKIKQALHHLRDYGQVSKCLELLGLAKWVQCQSLQD